MATSLEGPRRPAPAHVDLSGTGQHRFVILNNTGTIDLNTSAGGKVYGVLIDDPRAGEIGTVQTYDAVKVEAGAAVAIGDEIQSDNVGRAITAATTGHQILGIAEEAATGAGSLIRVLLEKRGIV